MATIYLGGEHHLMTARLDLPAYLVPRSSPPSSDDQERRTAGLSIEHKLDVGPMPSFLAFAPHQGRAFAAVEGGNQVAALRVGDSGTLEHEKSVACGGGPPYVSVDLSERWVFAASYKSGQVRVFPLAPDGTLGEATSTLDTGENAHCAIIHPSNTLLLAPHKGSDYVARLPFDPKSGQLSQGDTMRTPEGSGPRHLTFSSDRRRAYLVGENDCTIAIYEVTPDNHEFRQLQILSTLPRERMENDTGADVHVSPDSRFVYVSNRGDDAISVFRRTDEGLELIQHQATRGKIPRNFCLYGEKALLAANQESGTVSLFSRDVTTGYISFLQTFHAEERVFWVGPAQPPLSP